MIDITKVPFSLKGSYMSFSHLKNSLTKTSDEDGLHLRSIHGAIPKRSIGKLEVTYLLKPIDFTYEVHPWEMILKTKHGNISICFANTDTLIFKSKDSGIGLNLLELSDGNGYNYIHEVCYNNKTHHMLNMTKNNCRYIVTCIIGEVKLNQDWHAERTSVCEISMLGKEDGFEFVLEEVATEWQPKTYCFDYNQCVENVKQDWTDFYHSMPKVPQEYEECRELASYVNWTSCVKKHDRLTRDAMLMSKNWMTNVWSWDHCFNAMALAYNNHKEAYDQFMIMFDYQDSTGVIPDCVNDATQIWSFCKPPIHGWALRKMLKHMELSNTQLNEVYEKLCKWTNWWLNFRDSDNDGICEYYHGNDSGWDNSTAFSKVPPVELPDLSAFLIIQMDVLSELAQKLGRLSQASDWKNKADNMLKLMLEHSFENGFPKAVSSKTHEKTENESLILYLPIILGKRLPNDVMQNMLSVLKSDKFLTEYGFATESPSSDCYISDGYWRGPIWAPSSMIVIDGLYESGEVEFAADVTRRFCTMAKKSGFAENYDALSGEGLRDKAYTWTSSVFLVITNEFLLNGEE